MGGRKIILPPCFYRSYRSYRNYRGYRGYSSYINYRSINDLFAIDDIDAFCGMGDAASLEVVAWSLASII